MTLKTKCLLLAALLSTAPAMAEMFGNELILMASQVVVDQEQGTKVETCSETEGDDELLACVSQNANVSIEDYFKIKNGELLTGLVDVTYYDDSGDCALTVTVDADQKEVLMLSSWKCQ